MEPKQSARELLREARAELAKAHDHLLVDGNIIRAEGCFVDKIDAYLGAPRENAMEVVEQIRNIRLQETATSYKLHWQISQDAAAALIESYGRRVPRADL